MTVGVATVEIEPDLKKFGVKLGNDIQGSSGGISGAGRRAGSLFGTALKAGIIGAGAGLAVAGVFGKQAIDAASDLSETVSKTQAVFGEFGGVAIEFAESAASSLGLSKRAALDFTSSFGINLKEIGGLGEQQAANTAENLTRLTSDLASFFNDSTDNVADSINSALTGEFEPLKKYGVVINEAILKNKALELGLYDGKGALDQQAKSAATLALIYEKTGDAQGDFERTSGGLANQQRILSANFENVKAQLGEKLLPVAVRVATFLNDNFPAALRAVEGAIAFLTPVIQNIIGFVQQAIASFRGGASGEDEGGGFFGKVGEVAKVVFDFLVENVPIVAAAVIGFVQDVVGFVKKNWPIVRDTIVPVIELIEAIIKRFVQVAKAFWGEFGDEIQAVTKRVFDAIGPIVSGSLEAIQLVIRTITDVINGDWDAAWEGFQTIVENVTEVIKDVIRLAFDGIVAAVSGLGGRIASAASGMFDGVKNAFRSAINFIIDKWNNLSFSLPSIDLGPLGSTPGATINTPNIARLHTGGVVPGARGQESLYILEAGETVRTREQEASLRRGGNGINIEQLIVKDDRPLYVELAEAAMLRGAAA